MVRTLSYQLFKKIRVQLLDPFKEEAETLAFIIIEHLSGLTKTDILTDKPFSTGPQFETQVKLILERLKKNQPIQYILGKAYFYERSFIVNKHTLIPRQETEELVYLILHDIEKEKSLSILDIGTGTGCIPITLNLEAPTHNFEAVDIRKEALEAASMNAEKLGAHVEFKQLDILQQELSRNYDIIISNPPYVLDNEKATMKRNVLDHEPHQALFVDNDTPLLFYKRITELASKFLNPNGRLYFEINEKFGNEVVTLLQSHSFFEVKLHQDLNGKDRFVTGSNP